MADVLYNMLTFQTEQIRALLAVLQLAKYCEKLSKYPKIGTFIKCKGKFRIEPHAILDVAIWKGGQLV